jgi:hypothetical protein
MAFWGATAAVTGLRSLEPPDTTFEDPAAGRIARWRRLPGETPLPGDANPQLNPNNTRGVMPGEWAMARGGSKQYQLASYGAGPSVIVAAWYPDVKIAVLAHVDASTDLGSVQRVLFEVASKYNSTAKIQVHLAGGDVPTAMQEERMMFADLWIGTFAELSLKKGSKR